ncbi:MAG: glycoside hydrolase family 28 protein [Bacteroidaceae bacterium]|nr:glycoside hydrolase family 28 protein [Bacteroidaceae bacterium]MBR1789150.1 glycoside hydrolase family 28 protein [Bacteroidaceae bacterium]
MGPKPSTWGCTQSPVFTPMDFGAVGDGLHDDTQAVQACIDAASSLSRDTASSTARDVIATQPRVLLPAGHTFLVGPLQLHGNIDYHLEAGSRLLAHPDENRYTLSAFGDNRGEGMLWLWANGADNLTFSGQGIIDGNGIAFMGTELDDSYELKPLQDPKFDPRPHVLTFFACRNLEISGITVQNGAYWTIHLVGCDGAQIHDMSLLNQLKIRNGDGIDLDHTSNVDIWNCLIESGDDCICLKNRREYGPLQGATGGCHHIRVRNCVMTGRSCAIKIGSENMDSISDILFDHCVIRASNRALGIQNRDEGTVTNVTFQHMRLESWLFSDVWWGKAEPIYVTSYPRAVGNHKDAGWRFPKGATEGRCGEVSRITFRHIEGVSENGCFVGGDVPGKVRDIRFEDVALTLRRHTHYPLGVYDRRPCQGEGFITGRTYGLVTENAKVDTLRFSVVLDKNFPPEQYHQLIRP